jgi:hypothetical protein
MDAAQECMPEPSQPEILPPEGADETMRQRAQRWFSDERIDLFAHLLDDWFHIPFTPIRVGLDGLIGLIPGLGDILAGIASFIIILAAWIRGVPYVTLVRMLVNVGIEVVVGTIPLLGDAFDIAWKANRRNHKLMVRHLRQPRQHTWKDYVFLASLVGGILFILAVPLFVLMVLAVWVANRMP